ncbi:sugar-transfer associated ATP-grasp domain-containing protein [Altererythrobacter sp. GH1-8]|uniref:sugar-transfer associated ATP-grasp domain-containing protein n=1 Tax=Altererythrobacter sp. GH1-8 TaxID=3349333 RepID=UPI00374C9314
MRIDIRKLVAEQQLGRQETVDIVSRAYEEMRQAEHVPDAPKVEPKPEPEVDAKRKRLQVRRPSPAASPPSANALDEILGINARNALIAKYNPRIAIERARDKVAAKVAMEAAGIACSGTVAVIDDHQKLMAFKPLRDMPDAWAIKPARGSQGDGIVLSVRRDRDVWFRGSGKPMDEDFVLNHIRKIVDGGFSGDSTAEDAALIEPLIRADPALADLVPDGLPDLRVICLNGHPLMAMVRLPTNESDGKANLHQRAIGAGVSLETGCITRAVVKGEPITHHPDTGVNLIGFKIPHWKLVLELAARCGPAVGLGYCGADIVLDVNDGPLVIEVNAHPGIEIQNINQQGLRARIEATGEVLR